MYSTQMQSEKLRILTKITIVEYWQVINKVYQVNSGGLIANEAPRRFEGSA